MVTNTNKKYILLTPEVHAKVSALKIKKGIRTMSHMIDHIIRHDKELRELIGDNSLENDLKEYSKRGNISDNTSKVNISLGDEVKDYSKTRNILFTTTTPKASDSGEVDNDEEQLAELNRRIASLKAKQKC